MILSFPKLLGLFAMIWLVWMAFRFFEARQKNAASQPIYGGEKQSADEVGARENETHKASVDLQECDLCGAWFSGERCERENCPD